MNGLDKILRIIYCAASAVLMFVLCNFIFNWDNYVWSALNITAVIVIPALYLILILAALALGRNARLNLLLFSAAFLFSLYIAEFALILAGPHITLPDSFDRRTKLEVVLDSRQNGYQAFPSLHPKNMLKAELKIARGPVMPLAGIPQVTTVFCNETGDYYIYESDEYGFTNPKNLYSTETEIVLIGDSFTQGFCAPSHASYAEQIRKRYPNLLNLGNNGNGLLLELATLREFVEPIKPKYVLWFYFEGNDIDDTSNELAHPILKKYLEDPGFTQNLMRLTPEIDTTLKNYVETQIKRELEKPVKQKIAETVPGKFKLWLKLWHIRALLNATDMKRNWILRQWNPDVKEHEVERAIDKILKEANDRITSWGGQMIFIYQPSFRTFGYSITHPWRERVLQSVKNHGIPIIDLLEIFRELDDPIGFYNYRKESHFTPEGNAFVAQVVLDRLDSLTAKKPQTVARTSGAVKRVSSVQ